MTAFKRACLRGAEKTRRLESRRGRLKARSTPRTIMTMREKLIYILGAVVALLFIRNLFVILTVLPDEANQGAMYRIMFFHIPSWWTAGLALMLSAGTSVAYLRTGKLKYDTISVSVTEVA